MEGRVDAMSLTSDSLKDRSLLESQETVGMETASDRDWGPLNLVSNTTPPKSWRYLCLIARLKLARQSMN